MKNQELNLVELLKDCPKGTKFYSPIYGEVEFSHIDNEIFPIIVSREHDIMESFGSNGKYIDNLEAECLIFPSKDQRDWNVWKEEYDKKKSNTIKEGDYCIDLNKEMYRIVSINSDSYVLAMKLCNGQNYNYPIKDLTKIDKYSIKYFQPFDKVLVRDANTGTWFPDFYGIKNNEEYHICVGGPSNQCIPYNEETKHLLGTEQKAPEFYINWEE